MKKRAISLIALILAAAALTGGTLLQRQQMRLADKLVRLHVVADSDSGYDQQVKLRVRDAVLQETEVLLRDAENPKAALAANLDRIQAAANDCLRREGCGDRAVVTMGRELFPTREYETFSLPAGTYTALRVTIGSGRGHNWWCVVFPSICVSASAEEFEEAAQTAGLTEGEVRLITESSEGYELKFKSMELVQKLKNLFS